MSNRETVSKVVCTETEEYTLLRAITRLTSESEDRKLAPYLFL
jgi:hypothetical protein